VELEPNANGSLVGSFTVTEVGGVLAGVTVSPPDPPSLQISKGDIVRKTMVVSLSALVSQSVPITLTINAQNATPATVTVEWPPVIT
jgi:hypothetical protein